MNDKRKLFLLGGLVAVALALAAFSLFRAGDGDASANVADFAKSIDNTKGDTPSVPPERLALGVSGPRKGGR